MVGFPLLLIPLAVYNIIVLLMRDVSLSEPVLKLPLMSGAEWSISLSDILLTFAAIMLLLEIVKGARPGAKFLTDHLLSLIVFAAAAAEFVLWPKFGTSTFFLLTLFALVDFLTGVTLRRRRYAAVVAAPVSKAARTIRNSLWNRLNGGIPRIATIPIRSTGPVTGKLRITPPPIFRNRSVLKC